VKRQIQITNSDLDTEPELKSQMQITSSDLETEPEVKSQIQITNSDLENGEKISYVDKDKHRSHKKRKSR
jgi:hypothetical protein